MSGTWHRNWLWVYLVLDFVANNTEPKEFKVKSRAARDHEPQKAVYGGRGASVGLGGMLEGREREGKEGGSGDRGPGEGSLCAFSVIAIEKETYVTFPQIRKRQLCFSCKSRPQEKAALSAATALL